MTSSTHDEIIFYLFFRVFMLSQLRNQLFSHIHFIFLNTEVFYKVKKNAMLGVIFYNIARSLFFPTALCQHSCYPVVHFCSNWQTHLYSCVSWTRQAVSAGVRLHCVLY